MFEMDALTAGVMAILFFAALVRSTFGFADALIGMPLLALLVGVRTATPIMAFCAILVSVALLLQCWRDIQFRSLWPLGVSSAVGIPLGLVFLRGAHESVMKMVLAVVVLGFALFRLARPERWRLDTDRSAPLFGFFSGVLGGAYNTGGPPIVIFGSLRRWTPEGFRSTIQGFALINGAFILTGHGIAGLWTPRVFHFFLWAVPGLLLAAILGSVLHRRIPRGRFDRWILLLLLAIGGFLLYRSVRELFFASA